MSDFLTFIGIVITLFILLIIVTLIPIEVIEDRNCTVYSNITGKETKRVILGTCFVKHKDEWLTLSQYKAILVGREGLTKE